MRRLYVLFAAIQVAVAALALASLYGPEWSRFRERERIYQPQVEELARRGAWPPVVSFQPCYFGWPKELDAIAVADFPAFLIAGYGVIPSNTQDTLLAVGPGRWLPSSRLALYAAAFLIAVAVQWFLIGVMCVRIEKRFGSEWSGLRILKGILITIPATTLVLALAFPHLRGYARFFGLLFWIIVGIRMIRLAYWKRIPQLPQRMGT